MQEMAWLGALTIGAFLGVLAVGIYVKRSISEENIAELVKYVINNASNDAETQKDLYQIGGIIGQGVKTGVGLNTSGRRAGMWDAVIQLAGQFQKTPTPVGQQPTIEDSAQKLNA